jgi:hypothetical protein
LAYIRHSVARLAHDPAGGASAVIQETSGGSSGGRLALGVSPPALVA